MNEHFPEYISAKVSPQFNGNAVVIPKNMPPRGESAEREYRRLTREINELLSESLEECLPQIKSVLDRRYEATHRYDAQSDDMNALKAAFEKAAKKIFSLRIRNQIKKQIDKIAGMSKKRAIYEWRRLVDRTFGINLFEDYYNGDKYQALIDGWIKENADLIESIPKNALDRMEQTVLDGWYEGRPTKSIMKDLQRDFKVSKSKAQLLARDQTAKLNAQITKFQQTDAGVEEYVWSSSGDNRVRSRHRELDGKTFRWDDPPIVDEKTGRRCHPGEDYQCRCVAIPVFKNGMTNIPVKPKDWEAIDANAKKALAGPTKRKKKL